MTYAYVAIPRPLRQPLVYAVPSSLEGRLRCGHRVLVPFHKQLEVGYVIGLTSTKPPTIKEDKLKKIKEILDSEPIFSHTMMEFLVWMSSYYCAPIGEICKAALPPRFNKPKEKKTTRPHSPLEMQIPSKFSSSLKLNLDQQRALEATVASLESSLPKPILLHGVTGSGKTEIYLCAFEELLKRQGNGLMLVPEISLTPQLVQTFTGRFKDSIAVYHSGLTEAQRHKQWEKIKKGEVFAAIGTRSALFAPFENLRLIVIDEEHDGSYKQEEGLLYHARDAALKLAELTGAVVVLGSATPHVESYYKACEGDYNLLNLPERVVPVEGALLPEVEMVDMREELK